MPITKAECEKKGWFWNETEQTCKEPTVAQVKMTLTRGSNCESPTRTTVITKGIPKSVKKYLLKAGKKPKK